MCRDSMAVWCKGGDDRVSLYNIARRTRRRLVVYHRSRGQIAFYYPRAVGNRTIIFSRPGCKTGGRAGVNIDGVVERSRG